MDRGNGGTAELFVVRKCAKKAVELGEIDRLLLVNGELCDCQVRSMVKPKCRKCRRCRKCRSVRGVSRGAI